MRIKELFDLWLSLPFYLLILLKHFDARKKYGIRIGIFIIMNVFLNNV